MITVGCAGFSGPATRYFKEYLFVEVQETHIAVPGPGTLRRWRREAPQGFEFAMLAPREVGQEGFRAGKVVETALATLAGVGDVLQATTAVFVAPAEFSASRNDKSLSRTFCRMSPDGFSVSFSKWVQHGTRMTPTRWLRRREPLQLGIPSLRALSA